MKKLTLLTLLHLLMKKKLITLQEIESISSVSDVSKLLKEKKVYTKVEEEESQKACEDLVKGCGKVFSKSNSSNIRKNFKVYLRGKNFAYKS